MLYVGQDICSENTGYFSTETPKQFKTKCEKQLFLFWKSKYQNLSNLQNISIFLYANLLEEGMCYL